MSQAAADRNLLFGILALQMDFIRRDALIAAMHAWVLDKAKPLGQILLDQRALAAADRDLLEVLVQRHLEKHGHDAERSLAALAPPEAVRLELRRIADRDLGASLAQLPATPSPPHDLPSTTAPVATDGARFQILRPHASGGLGQKRARKGVRTVSRVEKGPDTFSGSTCRNCSRRSTRATAP
jgi:hypothetical protein